MATLSAVQDTLEDNDRFLPRYLTAQLIEILAKVLPRPTTPDPAAFDSRAREFINAHKHTEMFTQLTYSIFWRENPELIVLTDEDAINLVDEYSHSPLTIALANEDFYLAHLLIEHGAIIFMEHKLVLEIALTSIIQHDHTAIEKINSAVSKNDNWVGQYLEYLNGYAQGKATGKPINDRDVLNPTLRYFGQVLDVMVYFNGIPSHYGFLSPSMGILTDHLQAYCKELRNQSQAAIFKTIADAFTFTQRTCKYHCNFSVENSAEQIVNQITGNLTRANKDVILVTGGWAGNALAIAFVNKYLIFSNLGIGGSPEHGTLIYEINNPAAITVENIHKFMQGLGTAAAPTEILGILGEIVPAKPLFTIKQFLSPIDNCIFVNPRAIIQGILLVLNAFQKNPTLTAENLNAVMVATTDMYSAYIDSLYMHSSKELINFMRNQELMRNRRIECCSLAIEYINQHYKEQDALQRCIELKNALEFVGLRDHYNQSVVPEAKAAIQKSIIRSQEAAAMKVIAQEAAIQGKEKEA